MFDLTGRKALVTGATGGIGGAIARALHARGAAVALSGTRRAALDELAGALGERVEVIEANLSDRDSVEALVPAAEAALGGLDILVNNAGEQHWDEDITDISEEQLKRTFQTNIFSMFFLTQAARPHLKRGSAIINCTSVTMYKGSELLLDYSSTKGAITAFTRSLSQNLVKDGIRVNAVAPGPIWTPLNPFGGQPPEKIPDFGKDVPMGRPGQPSEVAPSFLFLACEDSSYMAGQVLHPNGGTVVNG